MRRAPLVVAALALACGIAAGPQGWGKLLWTAGFPRLAAALVDDDAVRGAALYEAGRYAEADAAFARVGRAATYDRGLTLAVTGRYPLAVAYFNAVLFVNRYDAEARHNRDLVLTLYDGVIGVSDGHGRIRTILAEAGVETEPFDPERPSAPILSSDGLALAGNRRREVTEARTVAADDAWLDTLADAPGAYLKNRLAAEFERRVRAGVVEAPEEERW
ncbi:MAG: hypothetical protein ACFBWO_17965 [Paracoccaceae bacterium]